MKIPSEINRRPKSMYLFLLSACVWTFCGMALAQTTGAAGVNGTVRDATGAAITGADVVLTETARAFSRKTITNVTGEFLFPSVAPAVYSLRVSKEGFQTYELQDIRVNVDQLATLDVSLKIGVVSSVVTVSAQQEVLLELDSNALGTLIDSEQVQSLPLNGRNFLDLVSLAGSSVMLGANGVNGGGIGEQVGHPSRSVAVAGNMAYMTGYLVDGVPTRGGRLAELALNVSTADIDEFKVQQNFFMPDQGPNSVLVSVTTKHGNNAFHGQAFEFVRNKAFDAINYFSTVKDDLKRNQFGGALGGPILKNKIWFYGFYEGTRQVETTTSSAFAPTQAMFNGDFSALNVPIYDPATYNPATGLRTAFPGNKIPPDRINAVSKQLLQFYIPGSSLTSIPINLTEHPRNTLNDDQVGMRLDMAISGRQTLNGQYIWENTPALSSNGPFLLQHTYFPEHGVLFALQHTYTFSPHLVNTAHIGFFYNSVADTAETDSSINGGNISGYLGITNTVETAGLPFVGLEGYSFFGAVGGNRGNTDNLYQIDDGLYYARGNHTYQFGGMIRYNRATEANLNGDALGDFSFVPQFTAQFSPTGPVPNTGDAFADFLLGYPNYGRTAGLPHIPYRSWQYMPYFSDLWKVTPNLTLNYGISWFLAPYPAPGGAESTWSHSFDPTTGLLTYAALGQVSRNIARFDARSLAPRLGVAWNPSFMPNTVLRAGAGLYYTDQTLASIQYGVVAPPFVADTEFSASETNPLPPYQFGTNVFVPYVFPPLTKDFAKNLPPGTSPLWLDPNHTRNPRVTQWNVSIQQALSKHDVLEVNYLGSSGKYLQLYRNSDQCVTAPSLFCDYNTRPYPRYAWLDTASNTGISSYEGLSAKYEHRASGGLDLLVHYTLGKALGTGIGIFHGLFAIQDSDCLRCNYTRTDFDIRQALVVSPVYDLPFGRGRAYGGNMSRPLDWIAGGWNISAVVSFNNGPPVSIFSPNTTSIVNSGVTLPNVTCNPNDSSLRRNLRTNGYLAFKTSCFSIPPVGYYGDSRDNIITAPGVNNWNIAVQKALALAGEHAHLQFRAEMFNAFNHAQFQAPDGNVADTTFGRVSAALDPRIVQLSLKLLF